LEEPSQFTNSFFPLKRQQIPPAQLVTVGLWEKFHVKKQWPVGAVVFTYSRGDKVLNDKKSGKQVPAGARGGVQ
jgi:hypothetical protein